MRRPYKVRIALLMLLVSVAATRAADAEVTTAAFASCNEQAPEAVKAGTATPILGDHVRAANARAGAMTTHSVTDFTGKVIKSSDPQIHGMDAEGAKDARYQAAYRSCMLSLRSHHRIAAFDCIDAGETWGRRGDVGNVDVGPSHRIVTKRPYYPSMDEITEAFKWLAERGFGQAPKTVQIEGSVTTGFKMVFRRWAPGTDPASLPLSEMPKSIVGSSKILDFPTPSKPGKKDSP